MAPPSRLARLFDLFLLGLAVLFAGLVASFVARNSDVWLHVATGRLITAGKYDFATDPLSYATEGVRWVNHTWLTDWLAYLGYDRLGGGALVVAKAVAVAAAVAVAVSGVVRRKSRWAVAVLAVVCVTALAPRATLQPFVISAALLAVLLRLLQSGGRWYFAVPVLVALWANLDEWYVLGPGVTLIHWACCWAKKTRPVPHWLPAASVAACLLTPFHVFGFTPPTELSPTFWGSEFARDPRIAPQYASPFATPPLDAVSFWAFVMLLVGGITLLTARRRHVTLWEGVTWVLLATLSVWQARLIPLVAVGSLAVFAPHVQELSIAFDRRRVRWLVRLVAFSAVLTIGVVAWTGWLNGFRGRDRELGWGASTDQAVRLAEMDLRTWRSDGRFPHDLRVLVTSPDATNAMYAACPGERGYLDTRWELHARAGNASGLRVTDRLGLTEESSAAPEEFLSAHRVGVVLLTDLSPAALARVLAPDSRWRVVMGQGRAVWLVRADTPGVTVPTLDGRSMPGFLDLQPAGRPERLPDYPDRLAFTIRDRGDNSNTGRAATLTNLFIAARTDSPALPLSALNSARQAVTSDPDSPHAWFELARAAKAVAAVEGRLAPQSGLFAELRRVQQVTALQQAVIAQPEYEAGHAALAAVLTELGFVDRALAERRKELAFARRRADTEQRKELADEVTRLENVVFDRECLFQVQTQKMSGDPLGRARVALGLGLADLTLDVLMKANADLYGTDGLRLLAGVLVSTGQAREALALLDRKELQRGLNPLGLHEVVSETVSGQRITYRLPAYDWFRFLVAASTGLSDPAPHLKAVRDTLTFELGGVGAFLEKLAPAVTNQVASEVGLGVAEVPLPRLLIALQEQQLLRPVAQSRLLLSERADLFALEGAVILEAGKPAEAREPLRAAVDDYEASKGLGVGPARPLAEAYLKLCGPVAP